MKIAINSYYGGFGLSKEAYEYLGLEWDGYGYAYNNHIKRTDKALINCIETLGGKANGSFASLKIVEIPDNIEWEITSYDGWEKVAECHRVWG